MATSDSLKAYKSKRNFAITSEPAEGGEGNENARSFVIQKHWASHLHYDFRLELDGSMKSWAIPKGPSLDPHEKRMAVHVEDHPISYNQFEGVIPPKQYGAGKVIIWDKGVWEPLVDPQKGYQDGHLKFALHGHKLQGKWALIRMKGKGEKKEPWLLIKEKDPLARPSAEYSIVDALPDSVATLKPTKLASPMPKQKRSSSAKTNAKLDGAIKAALPATLKPQLATLVDTPPADPSAVADWMYEIKFDGYRLLTRISGKKTNVFTRNGHDWSHKLPSLISALRYLNLKPGWFDGEIVVLDDQGHPNFQALQGAFDQNRTDSIIYYLFDLPYYDGQDLRAVPLIERRKLLGGLLDKDTATVIRFSEAVEGSAQDLLNSACRLGLEGLIGKRKISPYVSRRANDWIKLKCTQRQEFVIGGYTDAQGSRAGFGSLLLGIYDDQGQLQYGGNVGTGFDHKTLAEIKQKLEAISRAQSPFAQKTGINRKAHWVKPELIAEVSFGEWTKTGRIRHPVFHGLRTDKKASAVTKELATAVSSSSAFPPKLKITHPERVIDVASQTTKLQLVEFYSRVGPLMMEHLKARPVSLVRAPDGVTGELFFQKHLDSTHITGIKALDPKLDPGHAPLLEMQKPEGLLYAAQMNVIEFHTWNALKTNIDKPDRMTFDLDPGENVAWPMMQESAYLVHEFLKQLGLVSFLKTSGGKGLHIVVPLKRLLDWDTVKGFSQAIVQHLAKTLPQRFSAKSGPRNRVGKIFIDYLRNGFGATTVAAWSARARPGLGVSVPIEWAELASIASSAHWTIKNIESRLSIGNQPWQSYATSAQSLTSAIKTLGFKPTRS